MIDETLRLVINGIPNMIGLVLCIVIQMRIIDQKNKEHDANQQRYDALQAKVVEIALTCHDENAKSQMLDFIQPSQKETD